MQEQRDRARAARQETGSMKVQGGPLAELTVKSEFVGYNDSVAESQIVAIVVGGQLVEIAGEGAECQVILEATPFYAESGGQVSDTGVLTGGSVTAKVTGLFKAPHGTACSFGNRGSGRIEGW